MGNFDDLVSVPKTVPQIQALIKASEREGSGWEANLGCQQVWDPKRFNAALKCWRNLFHLITCILNVQYIQTVPKQWLGYPALSAVSQPWFYQMAWLTRISDTLLEERSLAGSRMYSVTEIDGNSWNWIAEAFFYQDLPKIWSGWSSVTVEVSMFLLDKSPLWLLHQGPNSAQKWASDARTCLIRIFTTRLSTSWGDNKMLTYVHTPQ